MAIHVATARPLPPIGAVLLCLEPGSTSPYPVTVERHLGRYLFAGGHRFHVYDDWKVGTICHTWRTAAAMVWLASPEEQAVVAAEKQATAESMFWLASPEEHATAAATILAPTLSMGESQWRPTVPPAGPPEPTECW